MPDPGVSVCVDVGGTFVDLALFRQGRLVATAKVANNQASPEEAVTVGVGQLLDERAALSDVAELVYSTTLAVNAVIERKGARTAIVTTRGFRDVVELRNEQPYDLYNPFGPWPEPLVPRERRHSVRERTLVSGTREELLDADEFRTLAERLEREGVDSAAVCFLHSYVNPDHEQQARDLLGELLPELPVSLSHEVYGAMGEYARFSTNAVNAYILPLVRRHLSGLEQRLQEGGFRGRLLIVSSAGGMMSRPVAEQFPVRILESGPAAGTVGANELLNSQGPEEAAGTIVFDMGGTTAKVSVIDGREPSLTTEYEVGRVERFKRGSGLLVNVPTVDIVEIGAGGGSIAGVDAAGLLAVGPHSAAASPGPACYGLGGTRPTVTDADLLLGYLDPDYFLGGRMRLSPELATEAIGEHVARPLGLSVEDAAAGIHRVVTVNMARAVMGHAAERGADIRRCALIVVGGAGPLHAAGVAEELRVPEIVVPPRAGVFSAIACGSIPPAFEVGTSYQTRLGDIDVARVRGLYEDMVEQAVASLEGAALRDHLTFTTSVDLRYLGQTSELPIPISSPLEGFDEAVIDRLAEAFEKEYESTYNPRIRDVPVEAVTWRLRAEESGRRRWPEVGVATASPVAANERATRLVHFPEGGFLDALVLREQALRPGTPITGPAVVDTPESTVVVPPGAEAELQERLGLRIVLEPRS